MVDVRRLEQVLGAGPALDDAVLVGEGLAVAAGAFGQRDEGHRAVDLDAALLIHDRAEDALILVQPVIESVDAGFQAVQAGVDGGDVLAEPGQLGGEAVHQGPQGVDGGGVGADPRVQSRQVGGGGGGGLPGQQAGDGDGELVAGHGPAATVGAVGVADHDAGLLEGVHRLVGPVVGGDVSERAAGRLSMGHGGQAKEGHAGTGEKH